jgi:hypothetical protein
MYLSEQEIVEHMLLYVLSEDAKRAFRKITNRVDLVTLHNSMGRWIRNRYNLWDGANPYVSIDLHHPNHPDSLSMRVIETIWNKMRT